MTPCEQRHPSTVTDFDDARRRARLRETRVGHGWRRLGRTRRAILRIGALLLLVAVVFAQYWAHDVAPERARLALTAPAVLPVADPVDPQDWDTVVVDMVGLGGLNASDTAAALPALRHIGVVWALKYDNRGIDTKVIAELIIRAAVMSRIPNVVLVGHSMGGVIALEVAKHIHTGSDLRLVAVLLDCTPLDLNAVRPFSRSRGQDMVRWMGWLPGARESRLLRLTVEVYARRDRFVDPDGFGVRFGELGAVLEEVLHDKIFSSDAASNGLIEAQFLAIVAGGAANDLRALARVADGKSPPAIVFLRPRVAARDPVVDVEQTHRVLIEISGGVEGTLLVVFPRNTGHANPQQRPREYNQVIAQQVLPFVQRYQEAARAAERTTEPR